jgi:hypothetical protein
VFFLSGFLWGFEPPLEFGRMGFFFFFLIKFLWMRCVELEGFNRYGNFGALIRNLLGC